MKKFAAALALLALAGCTSNPPPAPAASPAPSPRSGCASPVRTDALPEWARAGFSDDGSGTPHVYGDQDEILAVLFGAPLLSPPGPDRSNKILWVPKQPIERGGTLKIAATLDGTTVRADREVPGGPGPSGIDLPEPGCWHLTLTWSGRTDTMALTYAPAPSPSSSLSSRPNR